MNSSHRYTAFSLEVPSFAIIGRGAIIYLGGPHQERKPTLFNLMTSFLIKLSMVSGLCRSHMKEAAGDNPGQTTTGKSPEHSGEGWRLGGERVGGRTWRIHSAVEIKCLFTAHRYGRRPLSPKALVSYCPSKLTSSLPSSTCVVPLCHPHAHLLMVNSSCCILTWAVRDPVEVLVAAIVRSYWLWHLCFHIRPLWIISGDYPEHVCKQLTFWLCFSVFVDCIQS